MPEQHKRRLCFPLRLSPSLRAQASELAELEGISLNHFISLALTEKVTRMEKQFQQQVPYTPKNADLKKNGRPLDACRISDL